MVRMSSLRFAKVVDNGSRFVTALGVFTIFLLNSS